MDSLDGTLYDADNGYIKNQKNNILEFLIEQGISDKENVEIFWNNLFTKYNQTLRGLQNMGYKIDKEIYWEKIRKDTKRLAPNDIYKSCSNDVNFFPKWMLVEYQGSYFIKNLDNDRYLGYDNMNNKTGKKINGAIYMSPEKNENGKWAYTHDLGFIRTAL